MLAPPFLEARARTRDAGSKRRAPDLLLALVSTAFFLAAAELALRAAGVGSDALVAPKGDDAFRALGGEMAPWIESDPELAWRFKPGSDVEEADGRGGRYRYHVNALGFRGPEVPDPPGRPLVLCAGDSVTAGFGVDDPESYPSRLQELLRAAGATGAEVVNAGVNGYSSQQGRVLLPKLLARLRPDVVILSFGFDDDWPSIYPDASFVGARSLTHRLQAALGHSRLYAAMRRAIVREKMNHAASAAHTVARVDLDAYGANLRAMLAQVRSAGAAPILFAPTSRREHHQQSKSLVLVAPVSDYRSRMSEVAMELRVPFLDDPTLSGRMPESGLHFIDACHPNEKGHERLARDLAPLVAGALSAAGR